jgi:hypothetical protein
MNDKKAEMLRRLDALSIATTEMSVSEYDYSLHGESAQEPFRRWPDDAGVTVIYNKDGKVSRRIILDELLYP